MTLFCREIEHREDDVFRQTLSNESFKRKMMKKEKKKIVFQVSF